MKDIRSAFKNQVKENSILTEAQDIVNGSRHTDYGSAIESFSKIASVASLICGKDLTAADCVKVLQAVKLVRQSHKHKRDNLVDLAGYTEILNQIEENESKTTT